MKYAIVTENAASPRGAYSQGWRAGDFVFVSGQVPRDPATGEIISGSVKELVIRTLKNVAAVLAAEGATLADVVKFTVILQDLSSMQELNEAFLTALSEPLPARTTFQGGLMGVPVEIDAIAYLNPGRNTR
jgi:2-iminobutanoate/2-iminopropanoate deaminase